MQNAMVSLEIFPRQVNPALGIQVNHHRAGRRRRRSDQDPGCGPAQRPAGGDALDPISAGSRRFFLPYEERASASVRRDPHFFLNAFGGQDLHSGCPPLGTTGEIDSLGPNRRGRGIREDPRGQHAALSIAGYPQFLGRLVPSRQRGGTGRRRVTGPSCGQSPDAKNSKRRRFHGVSLDRTAACVKENDSTTVFRVLFRE